MMKKHFLILLIPVFFALSCNEETLPESFELGQEKNFFWGNEYYSRSNSLKITITEINDSRCPSDVVCVWQGEALVKINLETSVTHEIELSTYDNRKDTIDSFSIELLDVLPYPVSTVVTSLKDYTVKLKIEEIAD